MKPPNIPDTNKLCHMRSIWGYTPEALYVLQGSLTQDWLRSIISTACFSISHPLQVALKGVNACCSKDFILHTDCSLMVVGFVNNTKTCLACKAGDTSQMQMATFLMLWSQQTQHTSKEVPLIKISLQRQNVRSYQQQSVSHVAT